MICWDHIMAKRSPILSAKNDGRQIGYIEGNEVFDLLGRRRASSNGRTGNLCALDSGKIIGHVSLQGNFVGVSWIADELFSISDGDTHKDAVRREGYLQGLGVAGDIFKPRDAEAASVVHGNGEPPRPSPPERDEPTAELSSKSDGNTYRDILRAAGFLNGPGLADESFEPRDAKAAHAVRSIGETSSPPESEQGEPAAELVSKSWMAILTRKAVRKEGYLNGPGLVVADEAFAQPDAEEAHAVSVGETPRPSSSEQGDLTAELSSKSDGNTYQDILRAAGFLSGPGVAGEIFGQRDVEAAYVDHSIGEMPSLPPSQQGEPAAELFSKSDDITHQQTLRGEDTRNGPSLAVAGESFGDVEAAYADPSIGEIPSPPPSEQYEPAAKLSSKSDGHTHQEAFRGEESLNGTSLALVEEIIEQRDVEAAYADHGISEIPSPPPFEQVEPAADLSSKSDDNTHQQTLRGDDTLNGLSLAVADESFGQRDVEAAYADHGSGETPSPPPPSEQDEPAAELSSNSNGNTHQDIGRVGGFPNGPGLAVADEFFGQRNVEVAYADHGSGHPPSPPPPSAQGDPTAQLSSKPDAHTYQDILRAAGFLNGPGVAGEIFGQRDEDYLNRTSLAVADENFRRRDVEVAYADHGIGEMPSPPPSKQDEPAADLSSKSDGKTHEDILRGEDPLNGASLAVADEIFGRRDVEVAYADHGIGEMPSPPPSKHDELTAKLSSKSNGNTHQQTLRREDTLNGLSLAVADEIFVNVFFGTIFGIIMLVLIIVIFQIDLTGVLS
jgi:hypothetical protein